MITPSQSLSYAKIIRDFKQGELKAYYQHLIAGKPAEDFFEKMEKHLLGQHDQSKHGRWASSGLPHELENVKGSLQQYFDAGLITKKNEVTRTSYEYQNIDGRTVRTETRKPTKDTLDDPFMTQRSPDIDDDPEGYQNFLDAEAKMLGGNRDEIERMAYAEAKANGMGDRQALYYSQAIASRASMYVTLHNNALRDEAAQKTYGRDFADYKERGSNDFYIQREKTIKTVAENIAKAEPVVAIETDAFLGVIKDGRFKTQYETRESNGAYRPALRREAELAMSGVPLDTKSSERPIYGFLAIQQSGKSPNTSPYNSDKWNINNTNVGQYGEIRVVLNDDVKSRTSYTIPDSLDRHALPQPLSNNSRTALINAGILHDLSYSHGGFQRETYAEAQVYGGIKLKDIKAVYVVPSKKWNDDGSTYQTDAKAQASSIQSALSAKGVDIPVTILEQEKGR